MAERHFIAINYHSYYDEGFAVECAHSVKDASERLTGFSSDGKTIVFFNHSEHPLTKDMEDILSFLEIEIRNIPCAENGIGLNAQLREAINSEYDFFYRVDADDIVYPNRFNDQYRFFAETGADFTGGAALYRNVRTGDSYLTSPRENPGALDYILNSFVLHPTLAMRLSSIDGANLSYWTGRLEDKALMLSAVKAKQTIMNDKAVYGVYNYDPAARSSGQFARLNLKLNLKFIAATRAWHLIPIALGIFVLSSVIPTNTLRKIRHNLLHRKRPIPASGDNSETTRIGRLQK